MLIFTCKKFEALSLEELYATMVLRQEVFVVEQDCVYLDADGKDQAAWHLLGMQGDTLGAYLRIIPKGISYGEYVSIGRVVTSEKVRGTGAGKALMRAALVEAEKHFPNQAIKISAQSHLTKFYQDFGFEPVGEGYLEDGIPHIAMIRTEQK